MTLIEIQTPTETTQNIPVNTREVYLRAMEEANRKGQDLSQPLADILEHRRAAAMLERLANEPTTDEMRLEKFGTPLPEGHPVAPSKAHKIGASALR